MGIHPFFFIGVLMALAPLILVVLAVVLIVRAVGARPAAPPPPPQMSPDGKWWWDGQRWVPADQHATPPSA